MVATAVPLAAAGTAWWICWSSGLDLDGTGIVVGLTSLVFGTPLAIWAGRGKEGTVVEASAPANVIVEPPDKIPVEPASLPIAETVSLPALVGTLPREPRAFQHREDLMAGIGRALMMGRPAAVCSLTGARGVGKTQLAAAYARTRLDAGVPVAWLTAETTEQLLGGLTALAQVLSILVEGENSAETGRRVRRWLEARQEPYLIIFDNAMDPDVLSPYLPTVGRAQVLITTNRQEFRALAEVVPVDRFTPAEAMSFLMERVGQGDEESVEALIEEVDRLPLALSLAATRIVGPPPLPYQDYVTQLRSRSVKDTLKRMKGEPYPRGVAEAVLLSIRQIRKDDRTGAALQLLEMLSVMSPGGVSRPLLGDEASVGRAVEVLAAETLISFTVDGELISTHRLVQRVTRDRAISSDTLLAAIDTASRHLDVIHNVPREASWERFALISEVHEHALSLADHLAAQLESRESHGSTLLELEKRVLSILDQVAFLFNNLTDTSRAIPLLEEVAARRERLLGHDHPEMLTSRNHLAYAYVAAGRATEAIALHERTLADRERVLGDDHPDTLWSRNNLANAYRSAGRMDEAIALHERALADRERVLGDRHRDTLWSRNNLANAYRSAGRIDEAIALHERALADREREFGSASPDVLSSRNNLANAYRAAGRIEDAIALHERTLTDREQILGSDHPRTLWSRNNLANAYRSGERFDDAVVMLEDALNGRVRVLGNDHPDTLRSRHDLAIAYQAAGRRADAIDMLERALVDRERVLGRDHPATLETRNSLHSLRADP
ncbi:tetratricopeptide repeat protein [Nonomuraea angiospora]|uniref:tetratricopeptide repeat protein n=1 Tax=Nonomuraea angiospora TaxID=46172 RepID=UPI0033D7D599